MKECIIAIPGRPIGTFTRFADDICNNNDVMPYLPNTEANRHLRLTAEQLPRASKELRSASAAIGGKLEDALTRTVVPGATLTNIVVLAHSKAKAKAVAEVAEATARAKARAKVAVKVKAREMANTAVKVAERREEARRVVNDHGPERQAERYLLRGMVHPLAGDRLPKTRRRCAFYTPKGRAKRVTRIVRLYITRHVYFTRLVNAEMGLDACSRTETPKACLLFNRLVRN